MTFGKSVVSKMPLKYACRMNPEVLAETTSEDFEFNYIDIGNVSLEKGIIGHEHMRFANAPSRARKIVRTGDTIISTVRTYLKAVAYIDTEISQPIVSTGFAVLRPLPLVHARFLYRAVQSQPFVESVAAASTGVSYPAINSSTLGSFYIPLPDYETQKLIADFLDHETARIDQLIEKRQRFLSLIDEKKTSLATRVVDGSILPNNHTGCKGWFGSLPAHWKTLRSKFLFRERQDRSEEGDQELLTVSHITGVTRRAEKDVNMFLAESMEGYKLVSKGDVVINTMWAWMGAMGVSPIDGLISPSYGVYSPNVEAYEAAYLELLLRSSPFVAEVNRRSKGVWSSRLRLYPDAFLDILLPVPSREEQRQILGALQHATEREDRLAEMNRKSLDRLREFRSALITAAVTGQIDIANWYKRETTGRQLDAIEAHISADGQTVTMEMRVK